MEQAIYKVNNNIDNDILNKTDEMFPHKAEGYNTYDDWIKDINFKIQEYKEYGQSIIDNYKDYINNDEINSINNINVALDAAKDVATTVSFKEQLTDIENTMIARKQEAEAAEKKRALEQQQKLAAQSSSNYQSYSNGSGLTKSSGVNYHNGAKETYYNLNMSGVISNAKSIGIQGEYWVRSDGVKMYGDYVIVAAQMNKGTIISTSLGAGIVLDYCPAGTIDIATNW